MQEFGVINMRLTFIIILFFLLPSLQAETIQAVRASTSVSYLATEKTPVDISSREADVMPMLKKFGYRSESQQLEKNTQTKSCSCGAIVFDATTTLLSDLDNDGHYHRFKVAIDADSSDTHGEWVYAKLYLSLEGGPWNHYATSGDFYIKGRTSLDEFVVETELAEGFPTGYYDIRIELFDADFGDWLDTYGPHDDGSLNAIPLEDVERDDHSGYGYSVHGGGSLGWLFLASLAVLGLGRRWIVSTQA